MCVNRLDISSLGRAFRSFDVIAGHLNDFCLRGWDKTRMVYNLNMPVAAVEFSLFCRLIADTPTGNVLILNPVSLFSNIWVFYFFKPFT